jgi:isopenicillin-N epimerase
LLSLLWNILTNQFSNMPNIKSQFLLDPAITFLNFGSFGACPKVVVENQQKWQRELEFNPVQFITVNGIQYLQQSREALGAYIGCHADDVVYVTNPSYAVNIVAKSINLKAGDEVLTTNLEYGACDRTWKYYCNKVGATYVQQQINLPIQSKAAFLQDFFAGVTAKTKLIFISHITSSTGLILPVQEICDYANEKGILVFVDGAHAPAHVALDLQQLNVDIYTGACHKWMMTSKGSSFFYVKKSIQHLFDPLIISWGYDAIAPSHSQFLDYHQMQGTRDFTAFLTIPTAIQFMAENNWKEQSLQCKNLVLENAQRFYSLLKTAPISPLNYEFIGQMLSIPIRTNNATALKATLYNDYNIEIPIMQQNDTTYIRYSIQAFNNQQDLDILYNALGRVIEKGELILI